MGLGRTYATPPLIAPQGVGPYTTMSSRIRLGDLTPANLEVLRRINTSVLPAKYADKWYQESLEVGELAKIGMSELVARFACQLLSNYSIL